MPGEAPARAFHVELRQFPHNTHAFNLSEGELQALAGPWAHGQWIELGERKWNPNQARMTVLEGPRLDVPDLGMGRGWRNAERTGEDVTERVLARAAAPDGPAAGLEGLLGAEPAALLQAWRLAAERRPELSPSEALALAESTLRALDADSSP